MAINYVTQFQTQLDQKYAQDLVTSDLGLNGAKFINAQTIQIPTITVSGYKEHSRAGGFKSGTIGNTFQAKTLAHDRDISFFVDAMDVDETNQVLSAANITNTFETEQAIPETDAYRLSKIYADYKTTFSKTTDTTVLTKDNVLTVFDGWMEAMDDAGVPEDGRILYCLAAVQTLIKNASQVARQIQADGAADGAINRTIRSLDNVKIKTVPAGRFKTAYDFTEGFVPAVGALQMNMMLVHPKSIIAADKHSAIYLWAPGSSASAGDGWLYQNRKYGDLFLLANKLDGIKINNVAGV